MLSSEEMNERWRSNRFAGLSTVEDVRKRFRLPNNLTGLTLDELFKVRDNLRMLMSEYTYGDTMPAPIYRFLESEEYRVTKQIGILEQQDRIQELKGEVGSHVEDPEVREELSEKIDALAAALQVLAAQAQDRTAEDARLTRDLKTAEAKWQRTKELIQIDRVAVIVGAALLLGFATVLVVAMFKHVEVPEILSSAFLLILGFFFGQNTARGGSSGDAN